MVKRNSGTSKEDICQNQFTAYVVLAVKRKRQAYIKKKIRDKENQAKREEEQSNFGAEENTVWDRLEVQNEELVAAVQQLKPKARFIVTGYVLKGKTILDKGIMPSEKVLDFPVDCNTLTGSVNL